MKNTMMRWMVLAILSLPITTSAQDGGTDDGGAADGGSTDGGATDAAAAVDGARPDYALQQDEGMRGWACNTGNTGESAASPTLLVLCIGVGIALTRRRSRT